ncbi:MAG: hypothetical protein JOY84_17725 [Curvibacter sp.]|nr:hypothetical protein [Curvibacter sp.]
MAQGGQEENADLQFFIAESRLFTTNQSIRKNKIDLNDIQAGKEAKQEALV